MKQLTLTALLCFCCAVLTFGKTEKTLSVWEFSRDSVHWASVNVPHDWAIAGPFDVNNDSSVVVTTENGKTVRTVTSGWTGSLPWMGHGWYRTHVNASDFGRVLLQFDGAMSEPQVYVNGRYAGCWKYGYNAFRLDVTSLLRKGDNLIEVHLYNREHSSRWYPGGGLYRPVKLALMPETCVTPWDMAFRTLGLAQGKAWVEVTAQIHDTENKVASVDFYLSNLSGGERILLNKVKPSRDGLATTVAEVRNPRLWSPESPERYRLVAELTGTDGKQIDSESMTVGIRTVDVSKEFGFRLNGKSRKFQGVCMHHDLGPLGSAVNRAALTRQVKILKEMGCDAIRTSHNMPATMLLDVCDSLGMMVMAESFDSWKISKTKNDYHLFFDEWFEKDVTNLVLNHRNHPSVVMWSIGNEVRDQRGDEGCQIAQRMQDICHQLDPSRPVTEGMNWMGDALKTGHVQLLDIPGANYNLPNFEGGQNYIGHLPQGFLLGSESASTVSSRGAYEFPVKEYKGKQHDDEQSNGYDTECTPWSNLPDHDFFMMDDKSYTIGQFVWTGFDYLGEPYPYNVEYKDGKMVHSSRSSYFGIVDLAGIPKDRYYLYRSQWNKHAHTIHLLPHWTWPGREGEITPVYCYTDFPTAELFLNGKSMGKITKNVNAKSLNDSTLLDRYRLRWNNVRYEPGEIKVVVYDDKGQVAGEEIVRTAGKAAQLRLSADREVISADGNDISFVTVEMLDGKGNLVPDADDELEFHVSGAGRFKAVCNGDATSFESFVEPQMKLFHGKLVVLVQSTSKAGKITLTVQSRNSKKIKRTIVLESK